MKELQIFKHDQFGEVRVVMINGEPWWVAADVCQVLELGNPRSSLALLDDDEKGVHTVDTPGGPQQMAVINEPGLYSLILRSRKPEAKEVKRWVTHEILPAIRKHGGYIAAPADVSPEELMARALFVADAMIKKLKDDKAALTSKIEADRPKVAFSEAVEVSANSISVGALAVLIAQNGGPSIGRNRLFARLRADGYIHKSGRQKNQPTQKSLDMGLLELKESARTSASGNAHTDFVTVVTGKGQTYFVNKFKTGWYLLPQTQTRPRLRMN